MRHFQSVSATDSCNGLKQVLKQVLKSYDFFGGVPDSRKRVAKLIYRQKYNFKMS